MKNIISLMTLIILFGCNKNQEQLPPEHEYLIGTWQNTNGDEKKTIIFYKNGRVKQENEFARSINFKPVKCTFSSSGNVFYFKNKKNINFIVDTNISFDTLSLWDNFNQPDSTLNQFVYFVKTK